MITAQLAERKLLLRQSARVTNRVYAILFYSFTEKESYMSKSKNNHKNNTGKNSAESTEKEKIESFGLRGYVVRERTSYIYKIH